MAEAALRAVFAARGATDVAIDGLSVPAHFGDPAPEYEALRAGAGVVYQPWIGRLSVTGSDRVTFLQGMLSNDVAGLAPGTGCPALLLSEQGRAVAELIVLIGSADTIALDGVASSLAAAKTSLERYIIADDVAIAAPAQPYATFALLGPDAAAVVERLGSTPPVASYAHSPMDIPDGAVHVVRIPSPGVGGFVCRVPSADAASWWSACVDRAGAVPVGVEAFDVLRVESGVPWHGRDVGVETLALEAPYDAAISFRKGCYLGQEVMERVMARGHVNRKLVGIELAGDEVPAANARLHVGDREVGWITSAVRSWRLGHVIALAYVRREHLQPGTVLALGAADGPPAVVRALPF